MNLKSILSEIRKENKQYFKLYMGEYNCYDLSNYVPHDIECDICEQDLHMWHSTDDFTCFKNEFCTDFCFKPYIRLFVNFKKI